MKFNTIFIIFTCFLLSNVLVFSSNIKYLKQIEDVSKYIDVNQTYKDYVNLNRRIYYLFNSSNLIKDQAVKFNLFSLASSADTPLILTAQRRKEINSWQVPLVISARIRSDSDTKLNYYYWNISHTLCPEMYNSNTSTIFALSTFSETNITFDFSISLENLNINSVNNALVTPSSPRYFIHTFPPNASSLIVKVHSDSLTCAYLSIQQATCPVYDLIGVEEHSIYHAHMITKGVAVLKRSEIERFFIVITVMPNDFTCFGNMRKERVNRNKFFSSITVEEPITDKQFCLAIFSVIFIFAAIYLITFASYFFYSYKTSPLVTAMLNYYAYSDPENVVVVQGDITSISSEGLPDDTRRENEDDDDTLLITEEESTWYQSHIRVIDMMKSTQDTAKIYRHYFWNIVTISIFYFLPVIQLVLYFQMTASRTGDGDMCYYNYYCMYNLEPFLSFNSVFSNIGYILLGALFLIIVFYRERQYLKVISKTKNRGLPQRFDLCYAMGIGLMMEGLLSACYHICPSYNNFQFDTSFMYMIGWISALKIFFTRHNPALLRSHNAYMLIAFIVLVGVVGVVRGNEAFWIVFTFMHILFVLVLSFNFYNVNDQSQGTNLIMNVYKKIRYEKILTTKPQHINRLVFLIIINVTNWGLAAFGLVSMPKNFASYLLTIVISNFLLYFFTYILMKIIHRERLYFYSYIYLAISFFSWPLALYFFFKRIALWELTPAMSRMHNESCIWMGFYDYHDIWHFASSISLFFSFLVILTMDDALWEEPTKKIKVF